MLSICIAIHNWEVIKLVTDLKSQADRLKIDYEILLLDDASDYEFQKKNSGLDFLDNVTYLQSYINMGRSLVRNTLASRAKYEHLLFIDCDATVTRRDFLKRYLAEIPAQVVVGGTEYRKRKPRKDSILRWQYGIEREQVPAQKRAENPNASFSTFNFLIAKNIFKKVQFDESLQGYGHEDTLFGLDLAEQGIQIHHIDNALRHDGIGPTEQFLQQTQHSIDNLLAIAEKVENRSKFEQSITLLNTYKKLKQWKSVWLYRVFYKILRKKIEKNLYSLKPKIRFFDFYKLNYLIERISDGKDFSKKQ